MRLEDGLEHDLVEALLLELAVRFGSSVSRGSVLGSSELPSVLLLLCDHAAVPLDGPNARARVHFLRVAGCILAVEEAGIVGSGKGRCVKRALQIPKFLLAKVATDWVCDLPVTRSCHCDLSGTCLWTTN